MQFTENLLQKIKGLSGGWKIFILGCLTVLIVAAVFVGIKYKSFIFPGEMDSARLLEIENSRFFEIESLFLQDKSIEVLKKNQKFIKDFPDSGWIPVVLIYSGRAHQKTNRPDKALPVFQKVIDDYPDYSNVSLAIYELGVTYLGLGDENKANEYFNTILDKYPDTQAWFLAKSEYYKIEPLFEAGNYKEAIDKSYEVLEKNPGDTVVGSVLFMIGKCYYNLSDYNNALVVFQKIIDEHPDDFYAPLAVYRAGATYLELGEGERAKEYFKKLLEEYPNAPQTMADDARNNLK